MKKLLSLVLAALMLLTLVMPMAALAEEKETLTILLAQQALVACNS